MIPWRFALLAAAVVFVAARARSTGARVGDQANGHMGAEACGNGGAEPRLYLDADAEAGTRSHTDACPLPHQH